MDKSSGDPSELDGDAQTIDILLIVDCLTQSRFYRHLMQAFPLPVNISMREAFFLPAINMLTANKYDLVLLCLKMPDQRALEQAESVMAAFPNTPIIALLDQACFVFSRGLVQRGIQDCLVAQRINPSLLHGAVIHAIERQRVLNHVANLNVNLYAQDPVTGCMTRQVFMKCLHQQLASAHRSQTEAGVLYINIHGFKEINLRHGRDIGDLLLARLAEHINEIVESNDHVSRLGADEFVISISRKSVMLEAGKMARMLLHIGSQKYVLRGVVCQPVVKIGIALYPNDATNENKLVQIASEAARVITAGEDPEFKFYDQTITKKAGRKLQLLDQLRIALKRDEFRIFLQPQVAFDERRIIGAEALIRWQHPEFGLLSPYEFIDIAEESGLIIPLGYWIVDTVTKKFQTASFYNEVSFKISINVSVKQLQEERFPQHVHKILQLNQVPSRKVHFEITESCYASNKDESQKNIARLRDLGCMISIDDFGTGYSGLNYLTKLPVDFIKLDRSFITDLDQLPQQRDLVRSIIFLAKQMQIDLIAEGVETLDQAEALLQEGCPLHQGYFYAKPMAWLDFEALFDKQAQYFESSKFQPGN